MSGTLLVMVYRVLTGAASISLQFQLFVCSQSVRMKRAVRMGTYAWEIWVCQAALLITNPPECKTKCVSQHDAERRPHLPHHHEAASKILWRTL